MAESEDLRDFLRELILPFERTMAAVSREIHDDIERSREEMRVHFAQQDRKIDDLIAENQAQRQVLLTVARRLDPGDGAAPG